MSGKGIPFLRPSGKDTRPAYSSPNSNRTGGVGQRSPSTTVSVSTTSDDSTEDSNSATHQDRPHQLAHPPPTEKSRATPPVPSSAIPSGVVNATDHHHHRQQRTHLDQQSGAVERQRAHNNNNNNNNWPHNLHHQTTHVDQRMTEQSTGRRPQSHIEPGLKKSVFPKPNHPRPQSHIEPGLKKSVFPNPNHQRGEDRNQSSNNVPMSQPMGNVPIQFEDKEQQDHYWRDQQYQHYLHQQQQGKMDHHHPIITNRGLVDAGHIGGNTLAVAKPINEYENNFLPAAVEYDPDAKPPLHKNRRCRMYIWAASLMLCITMVGTGTVFVVRSHNTDPVGYAETWSPTRSPTSISEVLYRDYFAQRVGYAVFTPGTSLFHAAEWIMDYDQQSLPKDAPNLMQRYLMVLFYYVTTQNRQLPWRSCNPVTNNTVQDGESVHNCIYEKLIRTDQNDAFGTESIPAMSWLSPAHECEWAGVHCDNFQVVRSIELWGQNLTGVLPSELAALESLQSIALPYNQMQGTIPTEYAGMKNLISLELHGNALTGKIPEQTWEAITLQMLNFAENMLSGTISTNIGLLTNLKGLHLRKNTLKGTFPSEIGNLGHLSFMRIDHNTLSGAIPSELGLCTRLAEIWTQNNAWTGSLPSELGNLVLLTDLRFFSSSIGGTIPEELYNLQQLSRLELYDMMLTGTLSTRIGQLSNMVDLRLRHNRLSGTIPTEMANLSEAILVWIHLNQFQDSVPIELCKNRGIRLEFLNADCGPESLPANPCQCCTSCCDRTLELCLIQN